MTTKSTIGKAIDDVLAALASLEKREQQVAVSTVCSLLEIGGVGALGREASTAGPAPSVPVVGPPDVSETATEAKRVGVQHGLDIRTLKEQKQPDSARQMACIVAFYLQEHAPDAERKTAVTSADLERYFKQANFKLPAKLPQVLVDAKVAGYFEVASRGEYKLTRVGYNLVAHSMPKSSKA